MRERGPWNFGFEPYVWMGGRGRQGHRGPRRGRRRWFESGDMKYVILKLLQDRPMHGYEVMKALEEQCHGWYKPSPGTVYPTLQWLEDEELVRSEEKDSKKVYIITDAGKEFLEENRTTIDDIFDRVEETIDHLVGEPMPEVNRAVGRMVSQVYRMSWRLRADDERRKTIAEILEKATDEIEALGD